MGKKKLIIEFRIKPIVFNIDNSEVNPVKIISKRRRRKKK